MKTLPTWLAIIIGFVLLLGFKVLLAQFGLFGVRAYSQVTSNPSLWLEHLDDASKSGWYVIQVLVFFGAVCAGMLAALLSSGSKYVLAGALATLSLLVTTFEQFPRPIGLLVLCVWVGAPTVGIALGVLAKARLRESGA